MLQMALELSLQSDNSGEGSNEVLRNDDPLATVNRLAATLGENHPVTIQSMIDLSESFSEQGRWDEAEKLELQVVEFSQNTLGEEHRTTNAAKVNLAGTYIHQNRYREAEKLLLPVIDIMQRTLGRDHEDTLTTLKFMAVVYMKQGRVREAMDLKNRVKNMDETMMQEAITMSLQQNIPKEKASSDNGTKLEKYRPGHLKYMANKAATHWELGEWGKAEQLELKVVKSRQAILGKDDPKTLMATTNLAATYRDQKRWKHAEILEQQVMESRRRTLGHRHPDTLAAMNSLAGTYTDQSKWKEAQALYREVASIRTETLGEGHDKTLSAISALATNYWYQGKLKEAENLELKLLEARRKISGNKNPHTTTVVGNLAATYASQNRFDEAEKLQEEVFETLILIQGRNHCETTSAEELLGLYRQEKVRQRNEGRLEQEVAARSENIHTTTAVSSLEATYASPGELGEFGKLQEEVLEILTPIQGRDRCEAVSAEQTLELRGVMRRSERVQEQVGVRSFKDIAHKAVTFSLVVSLFFCSFFISFIYTFFTRLVICFLPTFTIRIYDRGVMVRKWKELADGVEDVSGQSEELDQK